MMKDDQLDKLKVSELKALLAARGLEENGKKAALVDRLRAAKETEEETPETAKDTDDNDEADLQESTEEDGNGENNVGDDDGDDESSKDNVEDEGLNDAGKFEGQEFVTKKPEGISFGLHAATVKKPQPKERPVEEEKPEVLDDRLGNCVFSFGLTRRDQPLGQDAPARRHFSLVAEIRYRSGSIHLAIKKASMSCSAQQITEVLNKHIFPFSVPAAALPILKVHTKK